jgi:hypothetical protein
MATTQHIPESSTEPPQSAHLPREASITQTPAKVMHSRSGRTGNPIGRIWRSLLDLTAGLGEMKCARCGARGASVTVTRVDDGKQLGLLSCLACGHQSVLFEPDPMMGM